MENVYFFLKYFPTTGKLLNGKSFFINTIKYIPISIVPTQRLIGVRYCCGATALTI